MDSPAMTDGFHLVVDALKLNAIDTIYGVGGIPITDLARLAQVEGLRYIGFRHEESAGNAAAAAVAGYLTKRLNRWACSRCTISVDASRRVDM